jgi:hypothetical protein
MKALMKSTWNVSESDESSIYIEKTRILKQELKRRNSSCLQYTPDKSSQLQSWASERSDNMENVTLDYILKANNLD